MKNVNVNAVKSIPFFAMDVDVFYVRIVTNMFIVFLCLLNISVYQFLIILNHRNHLKKKNANCWRVKEEMMVVT